MDNFFIGRKVLITGGAKGMGKCSAEKFYLAGATVIVIDKDRAALESLKTQLPFVQIIHADIFDWEDTKELVKGLLPLHHLVNNAGVLSTVGIVEVSPAEVERVFKINFEAPLNVTQVFSKGVINNSIKEATIVNISSVVDRIGGWGIYGASKAALTYLTLCSAFELGSHGIRINAVRPGGVRTNLVTDVFSKIPELEKAFDEFVGKQVIKEEVRPNNIADLVFYLSSPQSKMITGQAIAVDGGSTTY